jgi:hypothetical protein
MGRMLLHVPRMYRESEFRRLVATLPSDFQPKKAEFWNYIEEKLKMFIGRAQRVYRDGICTQGEDALNQLCSIDAENCRAAKSLIASGAKFEATEESLLVAESDSWLEMLRSQQSNPVVLELYEETMRERDRFVSKRIDETLGADECGVLFMDPARKISLNESVKVIKMCRFDPLDYLRSWQIRMNSKNSKV